VNVNIGTSGAEIGGAFGGEMMRIYSWYSSGDEYFDRVFVIVLINSYNSMIDTTSTTSSSSSLSSSYLSHHHLLL